MQININKLLIIMGKQELTLQNLSELSGISRQSLSYIKSGKSCSPITAGKIANALEIPLEELIE